MLRHPHTTLMLLVLGALLTTAGCGNKVVTSVYRSDYTPPKKIGKVALFPLMVFSASQTRGHESDTLHNDGLIKVTFTTRALSAAEYFPAQKAYKEKLQASLSGLEVVSPEVVKKATEGKAVPTFEDAVKLVAEAVDADAVATMKMRKVNLAGGDAIHGSAGRGTGHVDLELYAADGTLVWSIAGDAKYQKGTNAFNLIPDPAPALSDFTGFTLTEIMPDIVYLMAPLREGEHPEAAKILRTHRSSRR